MVVSDVLASAGGLLQPNEFDRKRIQLAVAARKRYRFVKAAVRPAEGGFRIESPCCSRRVGSQWRDGQYRAAALSRAGCLAVVPQGSWKPRNGCCTGHTRSSATCWKS